MNDGTGTTHTLPVIFHSKHRVHVSTTGLAQQQAVQNYLNAIVDEKQQQQQSGANNGKLVIGFSGGSMPQCIAPLLAQLPEEISKRLYLFPVDERLVPFESAESNAGTLCRLLSNYPSNKIPAVNVLRVPAELAADANIFHAAQQFERQLHPLDPHIDGHGFPMFDLLLLGLGPDGHTCSLFPGHALLNDRFVWVSHLDDSPKPPPRRITLTLPVLNAARRLAFIANGAAKADVIKQIVADNSQRLPPSRIELHPPTSAGTSGEEQQRHIEWFLDAQAAAKLTEAKVI